MGSKNAIAINQPNSYKVDTTINNFTVISDEPVDLGGTDLGPTPMEYLRVSLASCVAITLRMYVQRKEWELGAIEVEVEQQKSEDGTFKFLKKIKIEHEPTDEQMKRIKNIAEKCPVAKILKNSAQQETMFV